MKVETYLEQMKSLGISRGGLAEDATIEVMTCGTNLAKEPVVFHRKVGERKKFQEQDLSKFASWKLKGGKKYYKEK